MTFLAIAFGHALPKWTCRGSSRIISAAKIDEASALEIRAEGRLSGLMESWTPSGSRLRPIVVFPVPGRPPATDRSMLRETVT